MSNFGLYLIGVLLVVGAVAYGALQLGLDPVWIGVIVVAMLGTGIMGGVGKTRQKEEPSE